MAGGENISHALAIGHNAEEEAVARKCIERCVQGNAVEVITRRSVGACQHHGARAVQALPVAEVGCCHRNAKYCPEGGNNGFECGNQRHDRSQLSTAGRRVCFILVHAVGAASCLPLSLDLTSRTAGSDLALRETHARSNSTEAE